MSLTELGMLMEVKPEQLEKAPYPMLIIPSSKITLLMFSLNEYHGVLTLEQSFIAPHPEIVRVWVAST